MRHEAPDAEAARRRAALRYVEGWHPIVCADEIRLGVWVMRAPQGVDYGEVRVEGSRYRAETWLQGEEPLRLGSFSTLRDAAMAVHRRWLATHARPGGINGA